MGINNIYGTTLSVDTSPNGSYAVLYDLLDEMKMVGAETVDVWGLNGATLITFLEKRHAMEFKLRYPWSSELAKGPMFDNTRRHKTQNP